MEVNSAWVDPRDDPSPVARRALSRVTVDPKEIAELIELCKTGRIYAVERWIRSGRPLQVRMDDADPWQRPTTPLVVAIESGQYDLALLLLCNGYNTEVEPPSTLNLVLERRAWEYLELLLAWGADPTRARPYAVLDTYQTPIIERFWEYGVDFFDDNILAHYLASTTSNKPAYGWARRHNADPRIGYQLALALGDAVWEGREKAVALLMWAGADPHRQVPSIRWGSGVEDDPDDDRRSAIEGAVHMGHGNLLRYLKPDPAVDDFDELYAWVCDPDAVDHLFDLQPPTDWSKAIVRNISELSWPFGDRRRNVVCLERIFEHHWGRLSHLDREECRELRRHLLKMESDSDLSRLLQTLSRPRHCDEAVFAELTKTTAIRDRLKRLELASLLPQRTSSPSADRSRQRVEKNSQHRSGKSERDRWFASLAPETQADILRGLISRDQLYQEVWSEPATKVAERYGVSDVAVAKWCQKLNVPRPGRGYWARVNAGYRVKTVPLPEAEEGQREYVSRPTPRERGPKPPSEIPGLELFEKPIPVPAVLGQEHQLIAETRRALKVAEKDEQGILCPQGRKTLNVWVSEASVDRALRIMNALIQALEGAGFNVEITDILDSNGHVAGRTTAAVIHDERIAFSITEKMERKERPPNGEERAEMRQRPWKKGPFFEYLPTGLLSLQIESGRYRERHRRTWSDGKNRRLEDSLYVFIRSLLLSASLREKRTAKE
ncbi:MAG TPA: hypothetical protein PKJ99_13970 [Thermoanaerobaculales bacterium]|nr:hypothetical protein [Thermoanaerobaculales bacterium]